MTPAAGASLEPELSKTMKKPQIHERSLREKLSARGMVRFAGMLALPFGLAAAVPAFAEDEPTPSAPAAPEAAEGDRKLQLDEVEILGEIEKPKIFFILPKAQREAEGRKRRIRFYPDILEPLDKDRFEEEARVLYQHGIPAE